VESVQVTRDSIIDKPIYVGMDPGKSGAMVALYFDGSFCDAVPMPVLGSGKKERVQGAEIYAWLRRVAPSQPLVVGIERVGAMPGQGVVSTFNFGHATGVAYGAAGISGGRIMEVTPQEWQKMMLRGRPRAGKKQIKESAVLTAYEMFPDLRQKLLKRDGKPRGESGFADAVLIAEYVRHQGESRWRADQGGLTCEP
jgi:crossover junction endodeoxyribonuclease RuvC